MQMPLSQSSKYQHIAITENPGKGLSTLTLDGFLQTTLPNDYYYDILSSHIRPEQSVSILGGGDLTAIAPFKEKKIDKYMIYEIDRAVVDACSLYMGVPMRAWKPHVEICDALVKLTTLEAQADNVIVDLLSMSRFNELSSALSFDDFVLALTKNARNVLSGFSGSSTNALFFNEVLRKQFHSHGWGYFYTMVYGFEVFFFVSQKPVSFDERHREYLVMYPVQSKPAKSEVTLTLADFATVCREAF